jgi:putative tryptophan/tyrosine transport system substrate-binding protein
MDLSRALRRTSAAAAALLWAAAPPALAEEVRVVLSASDRPYAEALEGFREAFGRDVKGVELKDGVHRLGGAKVVVAVGGEAARLPYPEGVRVVACLAPGLPPSARAGLTVVDLSPAPADLLKALSALQPGLKTLGVLWLSAGSDDYVRALQAAAERAGQNVVARKLSRPEELADRLRGLHGQVQAVWVPPDPQLISRRSFEILKDFSWSNDVPFFTPTHGLVALGGCASAAGGFHAAGRTAAEAAKELLAGRAVSPVLYPEPLLVVNPDAAAQCGLNVPPEVLQKARVLP